MKSAILSLLFRLYQWRFRPLRGWSFISNNCVGGTLSQLAGDRYNSPTVGLWFTNDGYRDFCQKFPGILREPLKSDIELSASLGYPVGDLGGVKLMFLHYDTFEQAAQAWERRAARVNFDRLLFVCASKSGADPSGVFDADHLAHFRALEYPRVLLTDSIGKDERFAVAPPARYRVEDLHSWLPLARTLTGKHLRKISRSH